RRISGRSARHRRPEALNMEYDWERQLREGTAAREAEQVREAAALEAERAERQRQRQERQEAARAKYEAEREQRRHGRTLGEINYAKPGDSLASEPAAAPRNSSIAVDVSLELPKGATAIVRLEGRREGHGWYPVATRSAGGNEATGHVYTGEATDLLAAPPMA